MAFSIDHILFPTDFSDNAKHALPFAAEIAHRTGAKLTLFHSRPESKTMTSFEGYVEPQDEDFSQQFDEMIAQLQKQDKYQNIEISTVVKSGHPVQGLINQESGQKPDLIVMGTKGATEDRSVIFGSVTSRTITKGEIPVLAVPEGSTPDPLSSITFATDFNEGDWGALQQVIDIARIFGASIDILHVAEKPGLESEIKFRGFRELVRTQTDYEPISFHLEYEIDFFAGVAEYHSEHKISLLAMVKYKKSFWEKLAERDHSKELAFYTEVPLLVLRGDRYVQPSPVFDIAAESSGKNK